MQVVPRIRPPVGAPLAMAFAMALTLTGAGCGSKHSAFEQYSRAGAQAETERNGPEAEAYYVSALHRARTSLDKQEQSDALYQLGAFYRRQARFPEAARTLTESLDIAADAHMTDPVAIGRRRVELARALAALDRWAEGIWALRPVVPEVERFPPAEAADIRQLLAVYRARVTELGGDTAGLSE